MLGNGLEFTPMCTRVRNWSKKKTKAGRCLTNRLLHFSELGSLFDLRLFSSVLFSHGCEYLLRSDSSLSKSEEGFLWNFRLMIDGWGLQNWGSELED